MQRNGGARARVARKAATTALSQMAESAKRFRDYTSSDEEPVAKLTRKSVADVPHEFRNRKPEWHVAIDFGTTYTTVAWYRRGTPIDKIFTVDNFPGEKQHHLTNRQIPTEVWYPRKDARPLGHIKARDIRMRFGNEVHRIAEDDEDMDYHEVYDETGRVTMMKLLLDKTDYAQASKERLHETLESIIDQGHIKNNEDVFFHFFREIFRATRTRLGPDFEDGSSVEVTFCVPVCYDPHAVSVLGAAIESAMKETRFGTDGESPCNLFVVHEAEAQGMHALTQSLNELERGECFVLIDCGGGTTDIGIYRIALTEPLRLGSEVHKAMGAMVGAGDLNDRFRRLVKGILRKELYLENPSLDTTIDTIIEAEIMPRFENDIKRDFQYNDTERTYPIRIRGLRESRDDERIQKNHLQLTYQDIWTIFKPSVKKIGNMMEDAIINAKESGYKVNKIVVVGGFGDSPCLRSYLTEQRDRLAKKLGTPLKLRFPPRNLSATGVATGAILRSINKASGPSRIPCQSIGILRHIPCVSDLEEYPFEVLAQPTRWNAQEEISYVMDTIRWIVKKDNTMLESVHVVTFESVHVVTFESVHVVTFESVHVVTFESEHLFDADQTEWIIEETLWASETCTEDYFQVKHPKNDGKVTPIGEVEFEVTSMQKRIRAANRRDGDLANRVTILIEMTVIDRNLEFIARWPATPDGEIIQGSRKFFSVASAFTPGTQ